jgi:hypothetical protein
MTMPVLIVESPVLRRQPFCIPPPLREVMRNSGSRIPAPRVAPVSKRGARYEQIRNGLTAGLDQMGGYLAAFDEASGLQLWALKIYDNLREPGKKGNVRDVFRRADVAGRQHAADREQASSALCL